MEKDKLLIRLRRVKGQLEGLERMIESERECEDILIQVKAANKALQKFGEQILKCNLDLCIDKNMPKEKMKIKVDGMIKSLMNF